MMIDDGRSSLKPLDGATGIVIHLLVLMDKIGEAHCASESDKCWRRQQPDHATHSLTHSLTHSIFKQRLRPTSYVVARKPNSRCRLRPFDLQGLRSQAIPPSRPDITQGSTSTKKTAAQTRRLVVKLPHSADDVVQGEGGWWGKGMRHLHVHLLCVAKSRNTAN
jgi:hypothetical protein